jgi:hypothetical protein
MATLAAGKNRAEQCRAGQSRAEQGKAEQSRSVHQALDCVGGMEIILIVMWAGLYVNE